MERKESTEASGWISIESEKQVIITISNPKENAVEYLSVSAYKQTITVHQYIDNEILRWRKILTKDTC